MKIDDESVFLELDGEDLSLSVSGIGDRLRVSSDPSTNGRHESSSLSRFTVLNYT